MTRRKSLHFELFLKICASFQKTSDVLATLKLVKKVVAVRLPACLVVRSSSEVSEHHK
jgi:hypothetical protein